VRHYAKECKNRKNKQLVEIFGSLDYFEYSEEEALALTLKTTKE